MTMEWKKAHPERVLEFAKKYYQKNRVAILQRQKLALIEFRKKNPVKKQVAWNKGIFRSKESYHAIHIWLMKQPKRDKCDFCGSQRFVEWALKKGCKHEHCVDNYHNLCSSCHKKYDYTDERREKLRIASTGRKVTWGHKISLANKGRKLTEKHKKILHDARIKNPSPRNSSGQFSKTVVA